ncbi:MAG TPA: aminomethyl-transferring glycine dehydrogenase subunit GcvPA [Candidatus Binatia bacterium]|nr:aminomethyl-transferring glycine dehydrogenase subunit GcvPA [Candidatus Binatia bacterium]
MRFIPHTDADVERMLEAIGAKSIADLFSSIPASLRARAKLDLPAGLGEQAVLETMSALAEADARVVSFQGAGAYRHFIPSAVGRIAGRAEFATAYTPYQPEVSQGTLQVGFEFQTYVSILTGLEVANSSLYDGASALAEAVLMALRIHPQRNRILISAGVHPEYRTVVATYLEGYGRGVVETVPLSADGRTDLSALDRALGDDVAAVCVGYPSFVGVIDDLPAISRATSARGALTVSVTTEALSLALLRSPGECGADVAVAEGQSLGLPVSYGGPGVGLFATRAAYLRQLPGRLVGRTVDDAGRPGFVLTLSTREQHIRREKATSNICTNQGLAALAITAYLGLAGRRGLRELATANAVRAKEVADRLAMEAGAPRVYAAPFFNEFVIDEPRRAGWFDECVAKGLVPGVRIGALPGADSSWRDKLLVTVTECSTAADIDRLVAAVASGNETVEKRRAAGGVR